MCAPFTCALTLCCTALLSLFVHWLSSVVNADAASTMAEAVARSAARHVMKSLVDDQLEEDT